MEIFYNIHSNNSIDSNNNSKKLIQIDIDNRENKIINLLDIEEKSKFCVKQLPLGDIVFRNFNDVILLIERKTWTDLLSSIKDGRFRQQKQRIDECLSCDNVLYIIEGNKNCIKNNDKRTVDGAILNLLYKHKYKVLFTMNESDTLDSILTIYKKLVNNEFDSEIKQEAPIKLLSKGDKIKDNLFAAQLSVIPNVSWNIALKISEKYSNMKELINTYDKLETVKEKSRLLSDIQITEKRKLGNALSNKIFCYLCENNTTS